MEQFDIQKEKCAVVIVAGGKGLRMGTDIPKQFLVVNGSPILMQTIKRFYECNSSFQIIVVLPEEQISYWKNLCKEYQFEIPHDIAYGGSERFYSVKNGLSLVSPDASLIAIHDGVRPYVSSDVIVECFKKANESGAVIPVVDVFETLRHVQKDGTSITVPRAEYKLVQTPQVFKKDILFKAYSQEFDSKFTDDASVVENLGCPVSLVQGNRENIKITTKADLGCK